MFIRVDLPAPFSPMSPWIDPRATERDTARFAWTAPNRLSIPRSSSAGTRDPTGGGLAGSTFLGGLVLGDGDRSCDDVGLGLVQAPLHFRGDQLPVVLVQRIVDPVLGQAEPLWPRLPLAVPRLGGDGVHGDVDALQGRGEDASRMEVVLVAVAADG